MALQWKHLFGGSLPVVAAICILPIASGFGAPPSAATPQHQVNRAGKSDRLVVPTSTVAKRKVPVRTIRERPPEPEAAKRKLMDGCEPLFSPAAVPSAAHLTGRCIG
jgi:hypothetical protein